MNQKLKKELSLEQQPNNEQTDDNSHVSPSIANALVMRRRSVRCITINTDASFNYQNKVGGYAFYIICDLFKIQKGGMFKCQPKNAMEAEMMCMANALHTLLHQKELPTTNLIVINSDCLFSFEKIGLKKDGVGKTVAQILKKVRKEMAWKGVVMPEFDFRHVKAHNGKPDARSWVNDWCDKEAKKWMKKAVSAACAQRPRILCRTGIRDCSAGKLAD